MKQLIRNNVFETNSSSVHTLSIMSESDDDVVKLHNLNYHISAGQYGWDRAEYYCPFEILSYLWTLVNGFEYEVAFKYKEKMKEWCPNVDFDDYSLFDDCGFGKYFDCPGYVDHGGDYEIDEIFSSEDNFAHIVMHGLIRTWNDNTDMDDFPDWLSPEDAIKTYYKGN